MSSKSIIGKVVALKHTSYLLHILENYDENNSNITSYDIDKSKSNWELNK